MALLTRCRVLGYIGFLIMFPLVILFITAGDAFSQYITRVSVDSSGNEGKSDSFHPSISSGGHYIVFESDADNLVAGDTNLAYDIFVHDRQTGETTCVSVDSLGNQGNAGSYAPSISADGRYVVFDSLASNLVAGDTNDASDIFIHDRQTGETTRISVDSLGNQGSGDSFAPTISADGFFVVFGSSASNLVADDINGMYDIFVRDIEAGETTRVSVDTSGNQGNNDCYGGSSISSDGRYVAFGSDASNLVAGDTNNWRDVFVHDRQTGQTTRVSVSSSGKEGNHQSQDPHITTDGRYVAFGSLASNLVAGDTNSGPDVFVHDRLFHRTTCVNVASSGKYGNKGGGSPSISSDGRYVAFTSAATNLVAGDTNSVNDIFVHDRQTRKTIRVSLSSSGKQADNHNYSPSISPDGHFVAFDSIASNLVEGDTNGKRDIFVIYPPVNLITPNGGEFIASESTYRITWEAVAEAETFKLKYSLDNGETWMPIKGAGDLKGRNFDWTVPKTTRSLTKCLVEVTGYKANGDKVGKDTSDATFTISVVNLIAPSDPGISVTTGDEYNIEWTTLIPVIPGETVTLFYTLNSTTVPIKWKLIKTFSGGENPGIHIWTVPEVTKTKTKCKVKVVLKDAFGKTIGVDVSDNNFSIQPPP